MIRLADKPVDDREVETWFDFAGQDGGLWQMAINLVKKIWCSSIIRNARKCNFK